ncbi:MAG: homoserine O-acetyltransferase [Candidatus Lambdaproteobacteria bacterium]|nr:homoserine O-acetyltransferase [Candidatus Lambdaproteobacteria bacterium]
MPLNIHPDTKVHVFREPFIFDTPYMGRDESIPQLEVGYEAWGNPAHPAILVCHALSGNCHATDANEPDDARKSWWNAMVGPGRVIDTQRYYVICINMLGGCGGTSGPATINPDTGQSYGMHFPVVTVHDMVRSQRMLLDVLGVKRLHAVIGGSMGGFQALVWGILYPDFVERIIPVASTGYSNQFMIMTNRVQIDAIQLDPNYQNGHYTPDKTPEIGLAIARMIGFTTFISPVMMERKFAKAHQSLREPFRDGYFKEQMFHEAENYLRRQAEPFSQEFDANSMVYLLQTWNHFDLARKYGTLARAVQPIKSRMMLIAATGDNLFPPYLSEDIVKAMAVHGKSVLYELIEEDYGHDFFLIPDIIEEKIAPPLKVFLES